MFKQKPSTDSKNTNYDPLTKENNDLIRIQGKYKDEIKSICKDEKYQNTSLCSKEKKKDIQDFKVAKQVELKFDDIKQDIDAENLLSLKKEEDKIKLTEQVLKNESEAQEPKVQPKKKVKKTFGRFLKSFFVKDKTVELEDNTKVEVTDKLQDDALIKINDVVTNKEDEKISEDQLVTFLKDKDTTLDAQHQNLTQASNEGEIAQEKPIQNKLSEAIEIKKEAKKNRYKKSFNEQKKENK
jgi:hypothetical protein